MPQTQPYQHIIHWDALAYDGFKQYAKTFKLRHRIKSSVDWGIRLGWGGLGGHEPLRTNGQDVHHQPSKRYDHHLFHVFAIMLLEPMPPHQVCVSTPISHRPCFAGYVHLRHTRFRFCFTGVVSIPILFFFLRRPSNIRQLDIDLTLWRLSMYNRRVYEGCLVVFVCCGC